MSNPEYSLPQNAYANFDASSLKAFMINKLNQEGTFTDQNYEGSNISSILDILAYYTHVLLFYLNQTSSESSFSQTSIYENMNKIVKMIGYKPTGKQTSIVSVNCDASSELALGSYKIRKFSYFLIDNIQYTFPNDLFFEKLTSENETIASIGNSSILYQGTIGEYPVYIAEGLNYESFPIVVDNIVDNNDDRFISHGSISVYVKEADNDGWYEYKETDNLFLTESNNRSYELRLNENGHYEVKFGNSIFGKKLNSGDEVYIYYILSDGQKGQISKNSINGNKLFNYNSSRYNNIYSNLNTTSTSLVINDNNRSYLTFSNPSNSTIIRDAETVEEIRENSPNYLSTQLRLITELDYERFLKKSIPNILQDVKVVNNKKYIEEYIDYFYKICIDPNKSNRVIMNQVNFSDSCDFNNINVFCVPKFSIKKDGEYPEFLSNSFKNLIRDITEDKKMISNEIVPRDPIYIAFDIGYSNVSTKKDISKESELYIYRDKNNTLNKDTIKNKVTETILKYFSPENSNLGKEINLTDLTSDILSIDGVKSVSTYNKKENIYYKGLSFVSWNPIYENVDENIVNQTITLPFFKFPYIYNPVSLSTKITIIDE
jgi:hypothetical protein